MKLEVTDAPRPDDDRIPIDGLEFKECPLCAAKPGDPGLCPSCIHNREVIYRLQRADQSAEGPTMADVLGARRKMDKRISDAIEVFEANTGLVVDDVHASHMVQSGARGRPSAEMLLGVSSKVRLPG